jgi:FkbM family methyltransferase
MMGRMISYAQNGEDIILRRIFKNQETGFYIDIGASHPEHLSVTKFFYDRGWNGVNADPLKHAYDLFMTNRPRDTNLHLAIGERKGSCDFFEVSDYLELSTFSVEAANVLSEHGHQVISYPVEVITGNELFSLHAPQDVDFLKIDVEGSELSVLSSIDFSKYRPKVLVIEATFPNAKFPGWKNIESIFNFSSWEHILLRNGYIFAYFDGLNRFYVRSENKDYLHFFQVGPCLYDEYIKHPDFKYISELEWNCSERLKQVESLTALFQESETDRAARGQQIESLAALLRESETDRSARGAQIESLTALAQSLTARAESLDARIQEITAAHEAQAADLRALFSYRAFKHLFRWVDWPELARLRARLAKPAPQATDRAPRTIAVDLTPVLPGGENGGAKIFILELLRRLSADQPQAQFVLLTQAPSHDELATLDRPNLWRHLAIGALPQTAAAPTITPPPSVRRFAARILARLPERPRNVLRRWKRGFPPLPAIRSSGLLHDLGADLLFCPFGAPTYHEAGIPAVCTIHDLQYKTYPQFFTPEDMAHRDWMFIEACRKATVLASVSEYSRSSAIRHGDLDPGRIRAIPHRLALRTQPGKDPNVLGNLGLAPQRYLIYPANFWKHKNHEMLLTAFGMARHRGLPEGFQLVCTGAPGERQAWLGAAVRAMGLEGKVLFPGYVPNEALATLISASAGLVFPSLYEGFGMPVIEAMALGAPVACGNVASLPEIASSAARFFDPRVPEDIAAAMVDLVTDAALRERLIAAGQQKAAEFSDTERMSREYWELFKLALDLGQTETTLAGIHPDGWAGPSLNLWAAPAKAEQTLEIEFCAPPWLPEPSVSIQAHHRGQPIGSTSIHRGDSLSYALPLAPGGGRYTVNFSPCFIPAQAGHGPDERELSIMVKHCAIVDKLGKREKLFASQD